MTTTSHDSLGGHRPQPDAVAGGLAEAREQRVPVAAGAPVLGLDPDDEAGVAEHDAVAGGAGRHPGRAAVAVTRPPPPASPVSAPVSR